MDSLITETALSLPATYMTEQWGGAHVFKVGTKADFKMFAILRQGGGRLTVKAPDSEIRSMLIDVGVAQAHSHMPRGNWMVLLLDKLEADDVLERLKASYDIVFPNLPRQIVDPECGYVVRAGLLANLRLRPEGRDEGQI